MEEAALDFARQHPEVVLYVSPRSSHAPVLLAEYCEWGVRRAAGCGALPCPPWPCAASTEGPGQLPQRGICGLGGAPC